MSLLIIVIGALTLLAGLIILISPEVIFGYLRNKLEKPMLQIVAVLVRLLLGTLLIYQADVSNFPIVIETIGWLALIAGVSLAVIGRNNFKRLMSWALSLKKPFSNLGGGLAMVFGAYLIYAFI